MTEKKLMRGSHVIGEAAIRAGCVFYAGYPITPQNELTEYMSEVMDHDPGRTFVQAESEVAAVNMIIGASMTGARVMTTSSSPGISLKAEGISYLAAQELPAVIVNTMRGGPGLGNIAPSQGDYFQATRGGGHGDYRNIVLAPASGQELADLTRSAFDFADKYRTPVMILVDGMIGQMMEPVAFPDPIDPSELPDKPWKLEGARDRAGRVIISLFLDAGVMEGLNWKLFRKYEAISRDIQSAESFFTDDARLVVIAYGTAARIVKGAIKALRETGIRVGLLRPLTLWPFPAQAIRDMSLTAQEFLVFEMSTGQMVEDVRLALEGRGHTHFYGRPGGTVPAPDEIAGVIKTLYQRRELGSFS